MQTQTFTARRDGAVRGRLEVARGGTHVDVRAAELDELLRARFEGVAPRATAAGGVARIAYPRFALGGLLHRPAHAAAVELCSALPWSLLCSGGLGHSTLDLAGLELESLEVAGGGADLRIVLPEPRGVLPVGFAGGVSRVAIVRPAGAAVVLAVEGGASRLALDGERYGAVGGPTRLESPGADRARDRIELAVLGGASELTVAEDGRPAAP